MCDSPLKPRWELPVFRGSRFETERFAILMSVTAFDISVAVSFVLPGLINRYPRPTPYGVGCILSLLRSCRVCDSPLEPRSELPVFAGPDLKPSASRL